MKRLAMLALLLLLGAALSAETVLICHAQTLPAVVPAGFQSKASQTLVDMVFDSLFDKGDIAFDQGVDQADEPSAQWLSGLSRNFGADKVVYFRVFWKSGQEREVLLDRVTYTLVGNKGVVLKNGTLPGYVVAQSSSEDQDTRSLGNRLVSGLRL